MSVMPAILAHQVYGSRHTRASLKGEEKRVGVLGMCEAEERAGQSGGRKVTPKGQKRRWRGRGRHQSDSLEL